MKLYSTKVAMACYYVARYFHEKIFARSISTILFHVHVPVNNLKATSGFSETSIFRYLK